MGIALADAAAERGWPVTLLLGPVERAPSQPAVETKRFRTTANLGRLLEEHWPSHDLLIMAAAVADFRPAPSQRPKIKRSDGPISLDLEPTEDLLAMVSAASRPDQVLVGFALETRETLVEAARDKLRRKGIDAIVANPLETMDAERATVTLILARGDAIEAPADLRKADAATWLLDAISREFFPG